MQAGSIRELLCSNTYLEQAQNELHPMSGVSKFPGLAPLQTEMQDEVLQETNATPTPPGTAMLYGIIFLQWLRGAFNIFPACCKDLAGLTAAFP